MVRVAFVQDAGTDEAVGERAVDGANAGPVKDTIEVEAKAKDTDAGEGGAVESEVEVEV